MLGLSHNNACVEKLFCRQFLRNVLFCLSRRARNENENLFSFSPSDSATTYVMFMKKYKSTIISFLVVLIVIGGLILISRANQQNDVPNNSVKTQKIVAEESSFDFGSVSMAAGLVKHSFVIRNISSEPVKISKMYTSCMCTEASILYKDEDIGPFGMPGHGFLPPVNVTIDLDSEAKIEVVFDPVAHGPVGIGFVSRSVFIESKESAPLTLYISANVTP